MAGSSRTPKSAEAPAATQPAAASANAHASRPPRQPEKKIGPFAGGVGVAIWLNQAEGQDGTLRNFRSITVNPKRFFDRDSNQWKDAGSYAPADLPALIFCLQKAQEFVFETPLPGDPATGNGEHGGEGEVPF